MAKLQTVMIKTKANRHLQYRFVSRISLFIMFILFVACQGSGQADKKVLYVQNLLEYLKNNTVDSAMLSQSFFNDRFRAKNNPYNSYIIGLQQMKAYLVKNGELKINSDDSNADVYMLSAEKGGDSTHIFILVRNDGIESFSPLFKGKAIVGWI